MIQEIGYLADSADLDQLRVIGSNADIPCPTHQDEIGCGVACP
jgi:hypothetical protein